MFSKKNRVVKQFKELNTKLQSSQSLSEFYTVLYSTIDLTQKYAPSLTSIIDGLKRLPNSVFVAKPDYVRPDQKDALYNNKTKAKHYLDEIIEFIDNNGVEEPEAKPFLETNKILLPIIVTLLIVGLPAFFWWGWNTSKSNTETYRQREVDLLNNKIDALTQKIVELRRDSIPIVAPPK